jgi:hypothetical protein
MAPVDLEKGSSRGVVPLRDGGESKEKEAARMRTCGDGVRSGGANADMDMVWGRHVTVRWVRRVGLWRRGEGRGKEEVLEEGHQGLASTTDGARTARLISRLAPGRCPLLHHHYHPCGRFAGPAGPADVPRPHAAGTEMGACRAGKGDGA